MKIGINAGLLVLIVIFAGCLAESKKLIVSDFDYDFGNVNLGEFAEYEFKITNKTGKDIIIFSFDLVGTVANDYAITSGGTIPNHLIKNTEAKFTVKFTPSDTGLRECSLEIAHDGSGSIIKISFTGTGVAVPKIVLNANSHDFGAVRNGGNTKYKFKVENTGTAALDITGLQFTGSGAALFSVSTGGNIPINITPGAQHEIEVMFSPVSDGQYNAELEMHHTAVNEASPLIITLEGEGVTQIPEISVNQASPWDFGEVTETAFVDSP